MSTVPHQVAVVARGELLVRRIREALSSAAIEVVDHAPELSTLTSLAADADVLVLAGGRALSEQRQLIKAASERFPGVPNVVVASVSTNGVHKALEAGTSGLVLEAEVESALTPTIRAVCAGQVVVPHQFRHHAIRPPLSHREKQTLALVAAGMTNREIAMRLFLGESTVKTHLTSIFGKLGVRSRSEAAALVLDPDEKLGLSVLGVTPPPAAAASQTREPSW